MYFPSKKDLWMTIVIWLFAVLFIVPPILFPDFGVWMTPEFLNKQWIKVVILCPIGFGLLWIWFNTGYSIKDNILKIQYGPFKKVIKIEEIQSIRQTTNPFTALSLSINRIEVNYRKYNTIQISPKDMNGFLTQLMKINSGILIKK
ncbi:PH domain-containing protein [Bacillus mesophilum]|uniref:Uncharacterized protein YyaB-like PH domain-containing protein n=1 Tax=Bacillus mesophilum TaxID=1071718 RepID=A0A7V7UUL1_9BACI|nr:PH domain-containing protein [Bacillus mesophilum]KAB2331352.1 hypothetical protein F7732_16000 [Bacillus mesophilum]